MIAGQQRQASGGPKEPIVRRFVSFSVLVAALVTVLLPAGASAQEPDVVLYGSGTALVDGVLGFGEWDGARVLRFEVARPPNDGGGTMPIALREMNDGKNVYISVLIEQWYGQPTLTDFVFDNDHDGAFTEADDSIGAEVASGASLPTFRDGFVGQCVLKSSSPCLFPDSSAGGTTDGAAAAYWSPTSFELIIEMSHPLDDADNAHDWSLAPGQVAGFVLTMKMLSASPSCTSGCQAVTSFPEAGIGDLVVAPDSVAPETKIISSPPQLTRSVRAKFEFSGSDNLTPTERLRFSCKLDRSAFAPCSKQRVLRVSNGRHRLLVRARDQAGNDDATPAAYRWRVDLTKPTKPRIALQLVGKRVRVALSARDRDDPARRLKFRCAFDRRSRQLCRARFTLALPSGPHLLRVRAVDPVGNVSAVTMKMFSVAAR
jgi:hypothetical protein